MMTIKKFLVASGNSTLIVWDCAVVDRKKIIDKFLGQVEQIGFVDPSDPRKFIMMGYELSVNGTIAFASTLGNKGELFTSGVPSLVYFSNRSGKTTVTLPIIPNVVRSDVILSGIGYTVSNRKVQDVRDYLKKACSRYGLPAFGLIRYRKNKIAPTVYVLATDSLVDETACGSGSIAFNAIKNCGNIIQPTGEIISVRRIKGEIGVSAEVQTYDKND